IGVFAFRSSALVYASGKGYAAPAQGASMPPPPPPTIAGKVFCPQCGTENAAGARFCVKCGKEIRG
ncbi:MAG TPA: zinc ribbon domain-containing protein, partial [Candidatus Methanomethylicus sp.]|nr:zinc ribbon domain-containing protein [Candidatus Methanomethylicus sp.]